MKSIEVAEFGTWRHVKSILNSFHIGIIHIHQAFARTCLRSYIFAVGNREGQSSWLVAESLAWCVASRWQYRISERKDRKIEEGGLIRLDGFVHDNFSLQNVRAAIRSKTGCSRRAKSSGNAGTSEDAQSVSVWFIDSLEIGASVCSWFSQCRLGKIHDFWCKEQQKKVEEKRDQACWILLPSVVCRRQLRVKTQRTYADMHMHMTGLERIYWMCWIAQILAQEKT